MKLLSDREIKANIDELTPPLITNMPTQDWQSKDSPIQPCSVDLRIGQIQVPSESEVGQVQYFSSVGDDHSLATGQTAVLTTIETLNVPAKMAGIGFPPSSVSIKGLLMTNPGHVDPGYVGPMHFTVINMGRRPYTLRVGDRICTLLFFELDADVQADWLRRRGGSTQAPSLVGGQRGLRDEDVNRLSRDFVDVERRARSIANDAVRRARVTATVLAALVSIAIALVSQFVPYYLGGIEDAKRNYAVTSEQIGTLKERVADLEKQLSSISPRDMKTEASPTTHRTSR